MSLNTKNKFIVNKLCRIQQKNTKELTKTKLKLKKKVARDYRQIFKLGWV